MRSTKWILSLVFLLHGLQSAVAAESAEKPPNILLIITDQQFAEAMSCAGNPHVQTPAIDGLAARGMRFSESNDRHETKNLATTASASTSMTT